MKTGSLHRLVPTIEVENAVKFSILKRMTPFDLMASKMGHKTELIKAVARKNFKGGG